MLLNFLRFNGAAQLTELNRFFVFPPGRVGFKLSLHRSTMTEVGRRHRLRAKRSPQGDTGFEPNRAESNHRKIEISQPSGAG